MIMTVLKLLMHMLMTSEGKEIGTLMEDKNPLKEYKLGETSVFTVKADDGTELYCRMIKPVDFNLDKKYPRVGICLRRLTRRW